MEKTAVWMKLLPEKDSEAFLWDKKSERFVYAPSSEDVSLRDGVCVRYFSKNSQLTNTRNSCFVVLIDKQLLEDKKTYSFSFDKKHKQSYGIKLHLKESQYHASFDVNNPSLDPKWSKYFKPIMNTSTHSTKAVSTSSQSVEKPPTQDTPRYQTPRPFNDEFVGKCYSEGFILNCWETGTKDMITPIHEFKMFRIGVNFGEDESVKKFVQETLRFACACLNERTNGTIHFGVADEVDKQTCGYEPREVVGSAVTNKPFFTEKLPEFIGKCFLAQNVRNCIRPPVFIPLQNGSFAEQQSSDKVVIEVDIEPAIFSV
ncbi:sterile alpha motif [Desmophyllum pertusum]|uniref:Sterile alpha motif n=1 Tax=Desmophyllum pertusum TaxID=174260 RepID=A0A9W9YRB2_9CNID|nr:sterile alpha motif [Desmophyllum pertusum]